MEMISSKVDEHVLEAALQKQLSVETLKILSVKIDFLSEKGSNFLSDLYKVTVKYTDASKNEEKSKSEHSTDVIIKLEPKEEIPLELVQQQDLFPVESKVLRNVLPMIRDLVGHLIGPSLLHCLDHPRVLIMENLHKKKFLMKDRQKGLSFQHCRLVMQILAKFHAGSVAVHERNPELIESFEDGGIVSKKCPEAFLRLMEVSLLRIGHQVKNWSDEKCVQAAAKIIKMAELIRTQCIEVYDHDSDEFCVLNHGDCWINNIMFKENERGEPVDLRLVDYQMAVYTSPAIDLLYFLNICPELSVKYDHDDYFIGVYLNTLKETMERIGCKTKPPTLEQLKKAIHKRRAYAVFSGMVLYLRMMANKEDTEDFTTVLKLYSGETKMDVFKNPDSVKLALKMIPIMNEKGYFD
ncbi:uncharacterized protein LOC116427758 isoform X2 [Nomia melanderi]|uniref:uncharacterized protein LOC116427758 isoform X2 n=1 Tax=Nomia melanderi TaxID=2448451 RepID=UPI0013042282|nr:uncharacterized protein LOC116427758 isoform X2 [Nomia melanderi]